MTLSRRTGKIESRLSPTQLVLRWLDEAHAFGSLEAYTSHLLETDPTEGPLDRLCRETEANTRQSGRGRPRQDVEAPIKRALEETVFRFQLVMRINVDAHEILDRQVLTDAALSAHIALLTTPDAKARDDLPRHFGNVLNAMDGRVKLLRAAEAARVAAEYRYLNGRAALFPNALEAWDLQVKSSVGLTAMAFRLATLEGVLPDMEADASPDEPAELAPDPDDVAAVLADLVEPSKAEALEKLDEGRRAHAIATRWLRSKQARTQPKVA